mgnify:CR=1 FL=1
MFFTLYNYTLAASYMWIFVEALYLQILISVSVFMERSRTKWFMLLGWCEYDYHGYIYIYFDVMKYYEILQPFNQSKI